MRFPIRNIFPRWQIWVHCLSVHSFHLLPFCCYVLSVAQLLLFSGDFGITRLHSGTTCILEHFFRAYMFPFVHSTKKRCRSTLHRSHMLKTVFVCALAGCISKATPHNSCRAAEIFIPCNRTAVLYRIRLFPAMEGERSDGTSYLNNLPKPIRHTSLLYIGCFLSRSHAYPYHASLCDTLRPQQKVALYSSFPPG